MEAAWEQKKIDEILSSIDLADTSMILQYGSACFEKNEVLSEKILQCMQQKDSRPTGKIIAALTGELNAYAAEGKKKSLFGRKTKTVKELKAEFGQVEQKVDLLTGQLYDCMNQLTRDSVLLKRLMEETDRNTSELGLYIQAGKQKLAEESDSVFEKKVHDLELARNICMQMTAQIQMMLINDAEICGRIQAVIKNTIPAWKNCISSAMEADAVRSTNQDLIAALDGVLQNHDEGSVVK